MFSEKSHGKGIGDSEISVVKNQLDYAVKVNKIEFKTARDIVEWLTISDELIEMGYSLSAKLSTSRICKIRS